MMGSVCAEQQHKFHHSHQLLLSKKALRDIDIPPRKQLLLSRSAPSGRSGSSDAAGDSPAASFSKFLPYNNDGDDEDGDDPYSSDHFRMYEFKVRKCNRSRSHDWTDCPFAHPGEKARRRDPRRHHYSGSVCPDFRKGHCGKGDACELSHGVFECWLHPSRYRTEACKDGRNCKRKVCFFAHSSRQLRIVPDPTPAPAPASPTADHPKLSHHCCIYCHCSMTASPTSTLMAQVSPPLSPPISPYGRSAGAAYRDALAELMASFEAMSTGEASPSTPGNSHSPAWLDVNNFNAAEEQFLMSPSSAARRFYSGQSKLKFEDYPGAEGNPGGPDLGWVNDLLT